MLHKEITEKILRSFYDVYNHLGYGFVEKVYQNALLLELEGKGFQVVKERKVEVHYHDHLVGTFYADLSVEDKVILELKACENLIDRHRAQLRNYLKASDLEVGLLLNFGPDPEFTRVIYSNRDSS